MVVDASVVVAALVDDDHTGDWARKTLRSAELVAPHLMPTEVAETLRRSVIHGGTLARAATLAHNDLLELRVALYPYAAVAERAWELRGNLTLYDAWYVALAEGLNTELITLDARLARAPGPRCGFRMPETR